MLFSLLYLTRHAAELDLLSKVPHYVPISAHHEWNLDGLIEKIWAYLNLVRVYTKPRVTHALSASQCTTVLAVINTFYGRAKFRIITLQSSYALTGAK